MDWAEEECKGRISCEKCENKLLGSHLKRGSTSLHIYKISLDAGLYEDKITEHYEMLDLYPEEFTYQHDNLKLHKAAEPGLLEIGFDIFEFPRYSADLTPIENLWKSVKERVSNDNPRTEKQSASSLQRH